MHDLTAHRFAKLKRRLADRKRAIERLRVLAGVDKPLLAKILAFRPRRANASPGVVENIHTEAEERSEQEVKPNVEHDSSEIDT